MPLELKSPWKQTLRLNYRINWKIIAALTVLLAWFMIATVPYLGHYPTIEAAQMGIAAPAYKLATQGTYGNDLYTGFYRTEKYNVSVQASLVQHPE